LFKLIGRLVKQLTFQDDKIRLSPPDLQQMPSSDKPLEEAAAAPSNQWEIVVLFWKTVRNAAAKAKLLQVWKVLKYSVTTCRGVRAGGQEQNL
jgi:hypothetical protein